MKDLLHHARIVFFFTLSHKHFKREEKDKRERLEKKKRKEKEMNTSLSVAEEFLSVTDVTARTSFESVGRCHNKLRRPK